MKSNQHIHLIAGVCAGVAGLLTFLILHALWIVAVWFILPLGLLIAGVGGLAVGWSYMEMRSRLPGRPWTAFVIIILIALILAPSLILAELRRPMFVVSAAGVANLAIGMPEAVIRFIVELLLTTSIVGALLGWWFGRSRRAAAATALSGFVFALGPGHNIPFIGGTSGVGKELALIAAIVVVSALVLVEASYWMQAHIAQDH